jgi:GntR family transcriptional regulator
MTPRAVNRRSVDSAGMAVARPAPRYDRRLFRTRSEWLADSLVTRLREGEWSPGQRLPGEHQLASEYGVSRPTVRSALGQLEVLGLTTTRHGSGTVATPANREISADLRQLDSLSATIARSGHQAGMRYRSRQVRSATREESARLQLLPGETVFATERALTADGAVVAFSYDAIPRALLTALFEPDTVQGSIFQLLSRQGLDVASAITDVHAAQGRDIGWGRRPTRDLYVLLDQVHYLRDGRATLYTRTYFIEGRFRFSLARTL